jgi:hypothetical protein
MSLDKYYLHLAGEYRVASELLKRGLFATITYGYMKGIDIYAQWESVFEKLNLKIGKASADKAKRATVQNRWLRMSSMRIEKVADLFG